MTTSITTSSSPSSTATPEPQAGDPFRVIVVGAGIAGLTASHCLQKAGLAHIVLERRGEVDPAEGASFALYPHGARIFRQIGCLEAAEASCKPCLRFYSRGPEGRVQFDNGFFDHVHRANGQHILLLERRRLLRLLYDCLPDKSPVRTGADVKSITQDENGVRVQLADGTVETGDMVLGCDGVYSQVRNSMWQHAEGANTATAKSINKERKRIQTHWKCLVGTGPPEPGLGERDMTSTSDQGFSFLALTQPDRAFWFVFCKLEAPAVWPQRTHYTDRDAEALAESLAGHPVSETVTFGDLWRRRDRYALIPIQEGILERWFSGRVVLAGDSAHKMTPNIGLGGNTAIESVTVLCNQLVGLLNETAATGGGWPTQAALEACFAAYQSEQRGRIERIVQLSNIITRVQAWESPAIRWVAEWIMPVLPDSMLAKTVGFVVGGAPKLDYVTAEGLPVDLRRDSKKSTGRAKAVLALSSPFSIGVALVAAVLYYWFIMQPLTLSQ